MTNTVQIEISSVEIEHDAGDARRDDYHGDLPAAGWDSMWKLKNNYKHIKGWLGKTTLYTVVVSFISG